MIEKRLSHLLLTYMLDLANLVLQRIADDDRIVFSDPRMSSVHRAQA